jgi:hypothetical protein
MKTTLHFDGPRDLSVGTIHIHGEGESVADWVATPGNLTFQTENIKPGLYTTDIGPAGVAPQSVLFEVREGQDNKVILPPFSTLSASGSNTSYFDTRSLQTFDRWPEDLQRDLPERSVSASEGAARSTGKETPQLEHPIPLQRSRQISRISIGLSEETRGHDIFDTFRSLASMELRGDRVELDIPDNPQRDPWVRRRIRLSTAIEQVRIEHCLLPLYRGGTKITVNTPPFAPSDVQFNILPVDPHPRALLRALDAGTTAEAEAVRKHVVDKELKIKPSAAADPWVAMLLGLLSVRFPQIFSPIDRHWAASLAKQVGWACDVHAIHASHILAAVRDEHTTAQNEAVAQAISLFARAQLAGWPYYRYTNQILAEMADGIASYLEENRGQISGATVERFARVRKHWSRELALQRAAGAAFTWLEHDPEALRTRRVLVPNRHPSGRLPGQDTLVVFEGELSAGKISLLRGHPTREQRAAATKHFFSEAVPQESPIAAGRPPRSRPRLGGTRSQEINKWLDEAISSDLVNSRDQAFSSDLIAELGSAPDNAPPEDPNKGEFGGQSRRDGFSLDASFVPQDDPEWVTILLTVTAEAAAQIGLEAYAHFFLHPTFSPEEVTVPFRGGRAQIRIQAWGGFTVGVLIPWADVALECDLTQVDGAPQIIKTR